MKESRKSWWNVYLSKLRFKRESEAPRVRGFTISSPSVSDKFDSLGPMRPVIPQDSISESSFGVATGQRDEDYRDLSSYYEEGTISPTGSFILRPSPTSDEISENFVMASSRRHSCAYTISSDEWVIPSSSSSGTSRVLPMDDLDAIQLSIHFGTVMRIFTKVYSLAKIMHVVFIAYGAELDNSINGLMYWTKRAEEEIRTDQLATLIDIVEHLFYTLYARLQIELAAVELCALIRRGERPLSTHFKFVLPNNDHLYRIFAACKDFLDSPMVCGNPRAAIIPALVVEFQECFIYSLICSNVVECVDDDLMRYRRYAGAILAEQPSPYRKKWNGLIPFFDSIPANLMAILCEKYFTAFPKKVPELDIPLSELGLVDIKTEDSIRWEKNIIHDHRLSALSMLEGKSIGEMRRNDPQTSIYSLSKAHKCICNSVCFCAEACTRHDGVENWCPCAERHIRIMTARRHKSTGGAMFNIRANTLAWVCFQGLSGLKEDVQERQLLLEVFEMFNIFDMEIQKQRSGLTAAHWG
ncbi:uncharacterized protein N7443_010865 [Penicillium atrosanguineum]|uniref:uncharacterized protein n=1 Tax=Penicillium atrosanguineum TaxID=1132637 RepID=UPI00238D8C4E|nr:uncharacterized protein N7443_010865 [Penicillium atrosanguineum]KAJ5290612.1 hypothetical protein N7443_010865 [Penicillium atrosanguineum]